VVEYCGRPDLAVGLLCNGLGAPVTVAHGNQGGSRGGARFVLRGGDERVQDVGQFLGVGAEPGILVIDLCFAGVWVEGDVFRYYGQCAALGSVALRPGDLRQSLVGDHSEARLRAACGQVCDDPVADRVATEVVLAGFQAQA
jgi:hypothetical protein